jgi:hypothetical protein
MEMTHARLASVPITALLVALVVAASAACASLEKGLGLPGGGAATLDQATIADGLREALRVGTERTVANVSRADGFLGNQLIRIALPSEVEKMASTLRKVGLGSQVDELETSMNRAAEKASAEATSLFWEAVQGLTIDDARSVLNGGNHAATKLLRERTGTKLEARFRPIVTAKMDEVGLTRLYGSLADSYNALPLSQKPAVRLEDYVTEKTVDGVFKVLAKEEERIRADPVARTSEILQRVFR